MKTLKKHLVKCRYCGKIPRWGNICESCRAIIQRGGSHLPIKYQGEGMQYDPLGRVYCKICGMSSSRLGAHLKKKHNISAREYANVFGLQDYVADIRKGTAKYSVELETPEQRAKRIEASIRGTRRNKAMRVLKKRRKKN